MFLVMASLKHSAQSRRGIWGYLLGSNGRTDGAIGFLMECRWRIRLMQATFEREQFGEGIESRQRREERRWDEEARLRMDDEGCPNARFAPEVKEQANGQSRPPL